MQESIKTHGNGSAIDDRLDPGNETGKSLAEDAEGSAWGLCEELAESDPAGRCPLTNARVWRELDHSFERGVDSGLIELLTFYCKVHPYDTGLLKLAEIVAFIRPSDEMRAFLARRA